jgi:catechol 2,3-dioxygenase-like lactoylglutathione lyase family enzyme
MELAAVRIFVSDLPAATKFYADVVGVEQVGSAPSGNIMTFLQWPAPSKG